MKINLGNKMKAKAKAKEITEQFEEKLNSKQEEIIDTTENTENTENTDNIDTETEDKGNMLYGDYLLNEWLPYIKSSIEVTSYSGYENKVNIIAEYFNNLGITLKGLTRSDIKKFYAHLQETRNIKNKTINRYHANVHKSLEDAISEFEILDINVAHGLRKKEEQFIPTYYKQKDLGLLFEAIKGELIELHVLLASYYRISQGRSMRNS